MRNNSLRFRSPAPALLLCLAPAAGLLLLLNPPMLI
jgi:hypothetical protein